MESGAENRTLIGLNAVIISVAEDSPRVLSVRRARHALASPQQMGEAGLWADTPDGLPFGPFDTDNHRTLELGLHSWVQEQTGLSLDYAEQLYTFGDRGRDPRELTGGARLVSISYVALVGAAAPSGSGDAEWVGWYDFFPWEDWRKGRPAIIDELILPRLASWAAADSPSEREFRQNRIDTTFGTADAGWDFVRVLERYELLYEAELVPESIRDRQARAAARGELDSATPSIADEDAVAAARLLGRPLTQDHRRILATAMGRLRGKLTYRPVVFDLLPDRFTLLQLQKVVEALSGVQLHKQNFRRMVQNAKLVEPTGQHDHAQRGRPAELYRFRHEVVAERQTPGMGRPSYR